MEIQSWCSRPRKHTFLFYPFRTRSAHPWRLPAPENQVVIAVIVSLITWLMMMTIINTTTTCGLQAERYGNWMESRICRCKIIIISWSGAGPSVYGEAVCISRSATYYTAHASTVKSSANDVLQYDSHRMWRKNQPPAQNLTFPQLRAGQSEF